MSKIFNCSFLIEHFSVFPYDVLEDDNKSSHQQIMTRSQKEHLNLLNDHYLIICSTYRGDFTI